MVAALFLLVMVVAWLTFEVRALVRVIEELGPDDDDDLPPTAGATC